MYLLPGRGVPTMKCAVSDFDRTLYVDGTISREDQEAVERWQQAGHWFVLATGRNESSLRERLEELGDGAICPDILILNNGALILDKAGKELYQKTLDHHTAMAVLEYFDQADEAGSGVSLRDKKLNVVREAGMKTTQKVCDGEITLREAKYLEDILQIHHRRPDNPAIIDRMCEEINEKFPDAAAYSNVWNGDVVAKGVGKAEAIHLLEKMKGPFEEILVIGDSANDLEMIRQYAGAAVSVAVREVLEVSTEIVNNVAEYLEAHL